MSDTLIDRIYEAAFVPEMWPDALDGLVAASGSASGSILVFTALDAPPRYKATQLTDAALHVFTTTEQWRDSQRVPYALPEAVTGQRSFFYYAQDLMAPDQIEKDTVEANLRQLGLGEQITTTFAMPSTEIVTFTFERHIGQGRHEPGHIDLLDRTRPHLARAGLMAARLGLERAQATVSALEAIGLPAAILSNGGRVLASNSPFNAMERLFLPVAFGSVAVADIAANRMFQEIIATSRSGHEPLARSVPVKRADGRAPAVIHLLPLRRAAHEIFSGADVLVVVTEVKSDASIPIPQILSVLLDLTPAEARLAAALAAGKTLKQAAMDMNIAFGSARTYLARIFGKTGTNQQSQLVALLNSARPLQSGSP